MDMNDFSFCFDQQQKLSSPPPSLLHDSMGKKSQNMTECVPVPSSEHVAEIVGRQGKTKFDWENNLIDKILSRL